MKRTLLFVCALLLVASLAVAGPPNTYQVTGPVLELKDDVIVVQKGKDKWEIARGKATGIFTGGIDTGIFAGSLILGYIGDWFGLNVLFLCAGLSMASTLVLFRFRRSRSTAQPRKVL